MLRGQFLMRNFTMLKIFLTGAGTSALVRAGFAARAFPKAGVAGQEYVTAATGVPATALGSMMVGAGMVLAGGCPSLAYAQVGAGMERALITLGGLAMGVLAYALVAHRLKDFVGWKQLPKCTKTVYSFLGVNSVTTGVVIGAGFLGGALITELLDPAPSGWGWALTDARWHPVFCGIFVGLPQVPLTIALAKNIGASSSLLTLLAAATYPWSRGHPVMSTKLYGMRNWWQVCYAAGLIGAGLLTRALFVGAPRQPVADSVIVLQGLIGGLIGGFGSRLAGGCTSGHGISGNGHLATISMVATAGIFAGGMIVAFAFFY